ncbi:nuclear transport factor 2 family protein [Paraburkholderia sp. BL21I4N1]|uniref:nuclear transport factor 2 family protein n=1 Tax=Paraburkholderia sp. BL21I4N1 TaxID=1938801 RepID=UPI000CFDE7D6|nr:nuclear transport factor 2 family protein [Paraburkholderia sp. BL21I4N1]PQV48675.1 uncharacterized protein DUF4440 [Paraburkholderia sp. BL21I4N1]
MNRFTILATVGLLLSPVASQASTATSDEAALAALEQSWVNASSRHDHAVLDQILDDSFVETMSNGARRSKADALSAPGLPAGSSQTLTEVNVRVIGDIAVVTGVNHYQPAPSAKAIYFLFTDVYARRPNGWRAVSSRMRKSGNGA